MLNWCIESSRRRANDCACLLIDCDDVAFITHFGEVNLMVGRVVVDYVGLESSKNRDGDDLVDDMNI